MAQLEIKGGGDSDQGVVPLSSKFFSIRLNEGKFDYSEENRPGDILLIRQGADYVFCPVHTGVALVNNQRVGQTVLKDGDKIKVGAYELRYSSETKLPIPLLNRATGIDWTKAITCSLALIALLLMLGFLGKAGLGDSGNGDGLAQTEEGFGNGEGTGTGDDTGPGMSFGDLGEGSGTGESGEGEGASGSEEPLVVDTGSQTEEIPETADETGSEPDGTSPPEEATEERTPPPPPLEAPTIKLATTGKGNAANRSRPSSAFEGAMGSKGGGSKVLGTGDVQITLLWEDAPDVDLHVTDPNGEEIWFSNRRSRSGGELDVDDTSYDGPENVYWPPDGAPRGSYRVDVILFAGVRATWKVRTRVDGAEKIFSGSLNRQGQRKTVTVFTR